MLRYLAVVSLFLASISATAQMTHEETVVRTAYAKLAYAVQQRAIGDLASEANGRPVQKQYVGLTADQRLAAAQVNFTLQDFVVGDVRDILNRKAADLISPAVGEELMTGGVTENFTDLGLETHWTALAARWQPASPLPPAAAGATIGDLYELQWHRRRPETLWQRYASYSVTVSYEGKSRGPYKALFLFGYDDKGDEVVEPEDSTTNTTGLAFALHEQLFPGSFVLTRMRTFPVVSSWLDANEMSRPSCSVGHGDVCCDLIKLKCGPGREDVARGLSNPLPDGALLKR